jgi:hypothetical protein
MVIIFPQEHRESSFAIFEIPNDSELIHSNCRPFGQRAFPGAPKAAANMIVRSMTLGNLRATWRRVASAKVS